MNNEIIKDMKSHLSGADIPVGLGLILEGEPAANRNFHSLTDLQKTSLINYVQGAHTGEESSLRIANVVERLKNSSENTNIVTPIDDTFK